MNPVWLRREASGSCLLSLQIQPGARKTRVVGAHGTALKISLAAPPVDGKANAGLIDFLARQLELPRAGIEIVRGMTARTKQVRVSGLPEETIARRLAVICAAEKRP